MIKKRIKYLLTKGFLSIGSHFLIALGASWLLIECPSHLYTPFDNFVKQHQNLIFTLVLIIALLYGVIKSIPTVEIEKNFKSSNTRISIKVGNLLQEKCNIVCTTSNYFDTSASTMAIKNQILKIYFDSNKDSFDNQILESLQKQKITGIFDDEKKEGKNLRYEIGTTAIVEKADKKIFIVVTSEKTDKKGTKQTETQIENLQIALNQLWDKIRVEGRLEEVSIPVFGTGLARMNFSHLILMQMAILSYAIYSKRYRVSEKLNIIVNEKNYDPSEFEDARKFLNSILI